MRVFMMAMAALSTLDVGVSFSGLPYQGRRAGRGLERRPLGASKGSPEGLVEETLPFSNRSSPLAPGAPAAEGRAAAAARAYFAAWNRRDMAAAAELWAEDCAYEDTLYPAAFVGRPALVAHLARVAAALPPGFAFVLDDVADGGATGVRG